MAKPPPYIVNTTNRLAWNSHQLPRGRQAGNQQEQHELDAAKKIV